MHKMSLVREPFESVAIDITGPHPKSSQGNKFILTMVDHFSIFITAVACRTVGLSNRRTIEPSDYRTVGLSDRRTIGMEPLY